MEKQNAKVMSGGTVSRLFRIAAVAAAAVTICAGLAAAQDDDVEEFSQERVRKMRDAAPEEASLDGALAADAKPPEFVPKNEITIIPQKVDTTTAAKEKAGTTKSGKLTNAAGGRVAFGFGNTMNVGGSVKIGLSESTRIDAGVDFGFASPGFGGDGYWVLAFEANGFHEWYWNISDDGVFGWYVGAGGAFGHYSASGTKIVTKEGEDVEEPDNTASFGVGLGGQIGLEVNLSFIDPDHSLYKLKNTALSFDVRPMFYLLKPENYPMPVVTIGLAFRYAF